MRDKIKADFYRDDMLWFSCFRFLSVIYYASMKIINRTKLFLFIVHKQISKKKSTVCTIGMPNTRPPRKTNVLLIANVSNLISVSENPLLQSKCIYQIRYLPSTDNIFASYDRHQKSSWWESGVCLIVYFISAFKWINHEVTAFNLV